ncbi:hypothetical protein E4T49_05017 [Aureobasidium sp. EXF-10728]|nr:hypothetical protein E4T49_05017 [Aureobasidium sp. EXF-10728]
MHQISHVSFAELPLDKNGPHGNAWGRWGSNDQLGTLNYLTEEVVVKAARECVRTGQRISLNWSLEGPRYPRFARKTLSIKTINKAPEKHAHDDEWAFNSQCSSQWDGFRHYAYQKEALYYMGRTAEEFARSPEPNGVQHVAKKGIAGRAVFVDWYAWALEQGKDVDVTTSYSVPFSEILAALNSQGLSVEDFTEGDILVIRFGYLRQYADMDDGKRAHLDEHYKTHKPDNIGIEPSKEFLHFLFDSHIAAVAGDSRSFEVWPCSKPEWHLHEWLLAGWGMPIGELFDLEELASVPGGVASPPNALAFF